MCSFAAPPALFIAPPQQELLGWVIVVMGTFFIAFSIVRAARSAPRSGERRLWAGATLALTCAVAGGFLDLIIALPWQGALYTWHQEQLDRLLMLGCSPTALDLAYKQASDLDTTLFMAGKVVQIAGGLFGLMWWFMLVWGLAYYQQWRSRHRGGDA